MQKKKKKKRSYKQEISRGFLHIQISKGTVIQSLLTLTKTHDGKPKAEGRQEMRRG